MCRRGISSLRGTITVLVVVLGISGIASGKVIYVDADAVGANNGTSWLTAYRCLQEGLTTAQPEDEIRVAQGIYWPDESSSVPNGTGDRYATFQLKNGVTIKGGYAGFGEPDPNARDIEHYETILSGDLNGDDEPNFVNYGDNSYNVVTGSGTDETAVLDGFTITGGNADSDPYYYGGGMYNLSGSPTVTNCTFIGNKTSYGGGIYNRDYSSPTVTNCTFIGNKASYGGGIYNRDYSSPTVTNCAFSNNSANTGGGIYNLNSSNPTLADCTFIENFVSNYGGGMCNALSNPTITNCTFSNNSANNYGGGGMYNYNSTLIVTDCTFSNNSSNSYGGGMYNNNSSSPTVINCTFNCNSANSYGGGMYNRDSSSPMVTNCTFTGNSAGNEGGGMRNWSDSNPTVTNCIFWGNTAANGPEIYNDETSSSTVSYSDVEDGWEGEGNIDANPYFADPGYWDANGTPEDANDDFWIEGDYHLKSQAGRWDADSESWIIDDVTSPCIDAGNPLSPMGPEPFPNGGVINIGAYGGTAEASKSYFGNVPCEIIVTGDLNGDCIVNFLDFGLMVLHWLEDNTPQPGQASEPSPHDGATYVAVDADLGWTAGLYAASHDVYFGTNNPPPFKANQTTTIFDPGEMDYSTTYYWRIDEVNSSWTTKGIVWSFTTQTSPPP